MKKSLTFSYIACILCVFALMGVLIFVYPDTPEYPDLCDFEQLSLNVKFSADEQIIKIWYEDNSNIFYFFLPSGSENYELYFSCLGEENSLFLDDMCIDSNDSLENIIEYDKIYNAELTSNDTVIGSGKLIFMQSENLASMFVDTSSGNLDSIHADKNVKETARIALFNSEGNVSYANDIKYIKTRGNSTFRDFDKKPYAIKLNKEASLLGMPAAKKWNLLANAVDDTLIKNDLIFKFAKNYTSVFSIEGEFVDLYLNGNYAGNYYLCEKVEVDKNRLNITNLEEATKVINNQNAYKNLTTYVSEDGNIRVYSGLDNPEDITGGYLVEHISAAEYELTENVFRTITGHCYHITSPQYATREQGEYICNLFNEFESALAQKDGVNPTTGKHFSEYFDIDSWASKYVMEEVFHDPDSAFQSMYFYKDSDLVDTRIYSGPMWDYDRSMGSYGVSSLTYAIDNPEKIGKYGIYVDEMMSHTVVSELVYSKFSQFVKPYAEYILSADVYMVSETIEASAKMNRIRWPKPYGYYDDIGASRDYLIDFYNKKVSYLSELWLGEQNYCHVVFLDYNGNEYLNFAVKRGDSLNLTPSIANYENIFNGWYSVETGTVFDPRLPVYEDITYQAKWIDLEILLLNGLDHSKMDAANANPEVFRQLADLLENMQTQSIESE